MDSGALEEGWELRARRVQRWLVEDGALQPDLGDMLTGLCEQLLAAGLPLIRVTSHVQVLHSEHAGVTRVWRRNKRLEVLHFPHGARENPRFLDSPLKVIYETGEWLELRIDPDTPAIYNIVPDLQEEGVRHYVIAPLHYSNGTDNSMSWSTDRPEGFKPEHMALLHAILPTLRTVLELRTLHRTLDEVVQIYAGRGPGTRILSGQVRRGEVTRIDSAMLFCDMRNFTTLSADLSAEDLVQVLNSLYDCIVPAVISRAGEILKFLGDGVLAIFPAGEEDETVSWEKAAHYSCAAALEASHAIGEALTRHNAERTDGSPEIEVATGLHYGRAAYGNVGSGTRLDFTVIGRDVNLTSRISDLCALVEQPILMSEDFVDRVAKPAQAVGSFELKGIAGWTTVFAPS